MVSRKSIPFYSFYLSCKFLSPLQALIKLFSFIWIRSAFINLLHNPIRYLSYAFLHYFLFISLFNWTINKLFSKLLVERRIDITEYFWRGTYIESYSVRFSVYYFIFWINLISSKFLILWNKDRFDNLKFNTCIYCKLNTYLLLSWKKNPWRKQLNIDSNLECSTCLNWWIGIIQIFVLKYNEDLSCYISYY